jgi:hypothetical protein
VAEEVGVVLIVALVAVEELVVAEEVFTAPTQ